MNGAFKRKVFTGLVSAIFISLLVIGCENPGSTGSGVDGTEISIADTTVNIPSIGSDSVDAFSGRLGNFSAGIFDDPLFGQIKATTLIKPALQTFEDSLGPNTTMKLRLTYNTELISGDSLGQADFDLIEIDELWRAKAWKYGNQVPLSNNSPIASFTIFEEDSVEIALDQTWVDQYRAIYNNQDATERDSLHRYDFFGFAIVPQSNGKVIPFNTSSSGFVIEEESDTTFVAPSDWATSIERTTQASNPAGTSIEYSALDKISTFKMDLTAEELGTSVNISRVELVVPVDIETMNQSVSQNSNSTGRPDLNFARLHLIEPQFLSEAIDTQNPLAVGNYSEADSSFHFNITSFVNSTLIDGVDDNQRFYIALNANNGVLRSALIFNENGPAHKRPKLIITSINSEDL